MKTPVRNRLPDRPATPARTAAGAAELLFALCAALGVACYALGLLVGMYGTASLGVVVGAVGALGSLAVASTHADPDGDGRR
ncbi:hypothetical protein GCM10009017_09530 [Halarchaeum rubridurum]|nr:hypothetical protein GCM10009017_09530 [Halarchaeum rubridurum]